LRRLYIEWPPVNYTLEDGCKLTRRNGYFSKNKRYDEIKRMPSCLPWRMERFGNSTGGHQLEPSIQKKMYVYWGNSGIKLGSR